MQRLSKPSIHAPEFLWGVATSAYQVEGASEVDGKGKSIWDSFTAQSGTIADASDGSVAVDQYHRYEEDLELMRKLGVQVYSFTLAWTRIQPDGRGLPHPKGFDYYLRLLDALEAKGLRGMVTLFHWDLPQVLQEKGGWANRDTAHHFADYAEHCYRRLGERPLMWASMNEPFCAAVLGHLTGEHAPGIQDRQIAYTAIHYLLLADGLARRCYKTSGLTAPMGIIHNTATPRPISDSEKDRQAAVHARGLRSEMFLGPLLDGAYPKEHLDAYPNLVMPIHDGDLDIIATPVDFLGVNYYEESCVTWDDSATEHYRECAQEVEKTEMGWPIVSEGLHRHLLWYKERTKGIPLIITENGAAFRDVLSEDTKRCHDPRRIAFIRDHLSAVEKSLRDGVDVRGYVLWSFIDNFEWSFGYEKRFGLVYCDYATLNRIPKDSFYYYKDVIAAGCLR